MVYQAAIQWQIRCRCCIVTNKVGIVPTTNASDLIYIAYETSNIRDSGNTYNILGSGGTGELTV
jgi:hypothetical protein